MGDQITIPRTFAGQLGVADTLPSVRRHYMNLYNGGLTTGVLWPHGGAVGGHATTARPQNGLPFLQRNFTAERAFIASYMLTTSSATTVHQIDIMGGGTTIARIGGRLWNVTTLDAYVNSTTPLNANVVATQPIRIVCTRKVNLANRATIMLVGRERLD